MSKKVLSLVLALVMVLGSFSFVSAAAYPDVKGESAEAVDRLSTLGILEGYPDGTFKPEGQITRAEFAAVAVRAKGLKAVAAAAQGLPTGFSDVPGTFWASGVVGTAARLGIVNGIGNGQFAPQSPVKYEEAITMLVRALGYEAAAQAKGGYPYGYLIVANEIGLLDAVKGTQGVPATRGIVAQLTDNALEIPMMVQVGFGSEAKWVVSGSKEHGDDAIYLLDEMGFDVVEGRVIEVNTKKDTIVIETKDGKETVEVAEGFDFYQVEGLEIKAWTNNDEVIVYALKEEAKFDAVSVDDDELTLVTEDENYEVARNAYLELDGEKVKAAEFEADYAKVALNDDDEIVWAEGYTFDGFIVVEEVKEEVAYAYDDFDELDLEDFTIVKEGKTIAVEEIEEGDVVFYNEAEDFAVVYNNSKSGEVERVYADTFRFGGKVYSVAGALYLDDTDMGALAVADLDAMVDEEAEVEVFFDFAGKVVLVAGTRGIAKTNTFYAVLDKAALAFSNRGSAKLALDVINQNGEDKSYDLTESFVENAEKFVGFGNAVTLTTSAINVDDASKLAVDSLVKITVNDKGDVTKVEHAPLQTLQVKTDKTYAFKLTDSYAKAGNVDYRLQDSTVIFYDLDTTSEKVVKLSEVKDEFTLVEAGKVHITSTGRVAVVIATATDANDDTTTATGLVTRIRLMTSGALEYTFADGNRYVTDSTNNDSDDLAAAKLAHEYKVVKLTLGNKTEKIATVTLSAATTNQVVATNGIDRSANTIKTASTTYELTSDALVYNLEGTTVTKIALRDLVAGDTLTVYKVGASNRFVNFVVRTAKAGTTPSLQVTGLVTYINDTVGSESFSVDNKTPYFLNAKTILTDKNDNVVAMGAKAVIDALTDVTPPATGDQVVVSFSGDIMTIKRLATKAELVAAANLETALTNLQAAIAVANGYVKADYTTASWATFASARTAALALPQATIGEVNAKIAALELADNGLVTIQSLVNAEAAGVVAPVAATDASTPAGTVVLPTVNAGYTIKVKATTNPAFYDMDGKIVADGTAIVVFTVTDTASGKTADTAAISIAVDVQ